MMFVITPSSRPYAVRAVEEAPDGYQVVIKPKRRTLPQNDKLHAVLRDIAEQVVWHGEKLSVDEWRVMLSAAWKKQTVKPGIDGGFVVFGASTRQMTTAELSELVELAYAFGSQQGVAWNESTDW